MWTEFSDYRWNRIIHNHQAMREIFFACRLRVIVLEIAGLSTETAKAASNPLPEGDGQGPPI